MILFELPRELEADRPPEARGIARDHVRLLVDEGGVLRHARFDELPRLLRPGDLLVVNNSATLPAALRGTRAGEPIFVHLSARLADDRWIVELRRPTADGHEPFRGARTGDVVALPAGASLELTRPRGRLWEAHVRLPEPTLAYLDHHGAPIRYGYVTEAWPIAAYQTVFAVEPGSAEMPSAARAFTPEVVTELVARGIGVTPLTLHTGVSSLEEHEPPYAEWFDVPAVTARRVEQTRAAGGRVIAVGTTVVRALESAVDERGVVRARRGWTDVIVTPERGVHAADGLLTGMHEPRASHLLMLEAFVDRETLRRDYREAIAEGYLWHEFGDLHLLLPERRAVQAHLAAA